MNHDVEQSPNAMVDAPAQGLAPIQRWFGRSDREQLNRELNIRMEERLRERERIARDLHDSLFQGFLGAYMQIHHPVDRAPAAPPIKPSLSRALHLMKRVIDEGRGALQGLRSCATDSMTLEQA